MPTTGWARGPGSKATVSLRQQGSRDWEAVVQGEFLDVNLARLVGRRFPRHRLTGRARLVIAHARWGQRAAQGDGWVEAKGELSASQGSIGVDLIDALARNEISPLFSGVQSRCPQDGGRFPCPRAVVCDAIQRRDPDRGGAGAEFAPEAVIVGGTTALLSAPLGTASVHGLIKTLFPLSQASSGFLVPHTAESQVLLSLPVPQGPTTSTKRTLDGN